MVMFADPNRTDPYTKGNFKLSIITNSGVDFSSDWSKISARAMEFEESEYREGGGDQIKSKIMGMLNSDDITCERGMSENFDMWQQFKKQYNPQKGYGDAPVGQYRFNGVVYLLDPDKTVVAEWVIKRAWIKKIEEDELDALSSDVLIEKMTLSNEGYFRQAVTNPNRFKS
jgi:phage tail-like protein